MVRYIIANVSSWTKISYGKV